MISNSIRNGRLKAIFILSYWQHYFTFNIEFMWK